MVSKTMNFLESLAETGTNLFKAAVSPEAWLTGIDDDEHLWRPLGYSNVDLSAEKRDRTLKLSYWLYLTNPLGGRILELTRDFIVGKGATITAKEDSIQEVIDSFWGKFGNNMELWQFDQVLELHLWGEQFYPLFINKVNGGIRLGSLNPLNVTKIKSNPLNDLDPVEIKAKGYQGKKFNPVKYDWKSGSLEGDCFLFQTNKISIAQRGTPELMRLLDWIPRYDELLFNELDRAALMRNFIWDITFNNASEQEIMAKMAEIEKNPPKPGSVRGHSDSITWNAVTPDLKTQDTSNLATMVRRYILGGAGFAEHYFAHPEDTNRATAQAMDVPLFKRLEVRQLYWKFMLEMMIDYAIQLAVEHKRQTKKGTITDKTEKDYSIGLSEIFRRELETVANILSSLVGALILAEQQKWISQETSRVLFTNFLASELGFEIEPSEEKKRLEKDGIEESLQAWGGKARYDLVNEALDRVKENSVKI
jgi:hypothetical protein